MSRSRLIAASICLFGFFYSAWAFDPPPVEPKPAKLFPGPIVPVRERTEIVGLMKRVADWQLGFNDTRRFTHWTRAVGYLGLLSANRVTGDLKYEQELMKMSEAAGWKPGKALYHADDHIVGQVYLTLFEKYRDPRMIAPTRESFDRILAAPRTSTLEYGGWDKSDRWCWCDALFMAPPVWGAMARTTGDSRYLDFMLKEWTEAEEYLYDKEDGLYHRDSRFFTLKERNGRKIFWSRGNGWVLAAYPRIIPFIPEQHPLRAQIVARYREFSKRIVDLQPEDGLWRVSLLDTDRYTVGETSGSALFCYALAWGINAGILDKSIFLAPTLKAWDALAAHVQPDGMLIRAQPVGHRPFRFDPDTTEVYASGSLLLAGEQIFQLLSPTHNPN